MYFGKIYLIGACLLIFAINAAAQVRKNPANDNLPARVVCGSPPAAANVQETRRRRSGKTMGRKNLDEIISAARSRTAALIARDSGRLRDLLAPDFVYTNASGKVLDREAYIRNYALDESVTWTSQTLSDVCVRFSGDAAVLTAVTHDVARFGDYQLDARFRTTQVYRRTGGRWIYLAGHTSNID